MSEITEQFKSMMESDCAGSGTARERRERGAWIGGEGIEGSMHDSQRRRPFKTRAMGLLDSELQDPGIPILVSMSHLNSPLVSSMPTQSPLSMMSQQQAPSLLAPPTPSRGSGRRRFTLCGVGEEQSLPVCQTHRRGLTVYCRSDGVCICPECQATEHQGHDTVSVETEWMENKARLGVLEQHIQDMIRERVGKMEGIRMSVTELQMAVERETAGSLCVFSALACTVERAQAEVMEAMEGKRKAAEQHAEALIRQLEEEISTLKRRGHALSELSQSEDHAHCVKRFPTLSSPPPTRDWSAVSVNSDLGTTAIYTELAALVGKFQEQLNNAADMGFPPSVVEPSPARTSTRRPSEVVVGGKSDWDLGVASESSNRKGKIEVTPSNGYWFLSLRDRNKCAFRTEPCTDVHLTRLAFSWTTKKDRSPSTIENLHPFFSPCTNRSGKNDGPLVITALHQIQ
ncbi:hypothetical protein NHX12_014232 [Muraenolepis orangiensis]|uniref:B box-type domain-containing protein n=1 Tax=Muraenolepis orangiensis TaxID=630683 RepID=A0A9Q0DDD3_9TELE|nr:hypothetical protein NHX12_014232 [Muraenolepis orangiensis]